MIMEGETRGIFRKAIDAVNPGWLSFCGGIGLLAFIFSISCRIMDFNPGPLWEKHYDIMLENRRINKDEFEDKIKSLEERIKYLESKSHEKGK